MERQNKWKTLAASLNQFEEPQFKVSDRSVRDRYNLLEKQFKTKQNRLDKASGEGEIEEESELEKGIRDCIEQFKDSDLEQTKKKETAEEEKNQAEELRLRS